MAADENAEPLGIRRRSLDYLSDVLRDVGLLHLPPGCELLGTGRGSGRRKRYGRLVCRRHDRCDFPSR